MAPEGNSCPVAVCGRPLCTSSYLIDQRSFLYHSSRFATQRTLVSIHTNTLIYILNTVVSATRCLHCCYLRPCPGAPWALWISGKQFGNINRGFYDTHSSTNQFSSVSTRTRKLGVIKDCGQRWCCVLGLQGTCNEGGGRNMEQVQNTLSLA